MIFVRHVQAEIIWYLIFILILSSASTGMHEFQLSGNYNSDKASGTEEDQSWHLSLQRFLQNQDYFFLDRAQHENNYE